MNRPICKSCDNTIDDIKDEARVDIFVDLVPMNTEKSVRRYKGYMILHYWCARDIKMCISQDYAKLKKVP